MGTEPKLGTHWHGCWKAHDDCCEEAVKFLAEGAEALMLDVLADDDEDPNALEMRHRLHLLGFTQTELIDGGEDETWEADWGAGP